MDMHLFYFTDETIRNVVERAGFTMVHSTSYRHVTTVEYLLRKLGTLGVPGATSASHLASITPWGKSQIPVRLGDIQLFACTKVAEARPSERATVRGDARRNGHGSAISTRRTVLSD
jgi:hypothetical protein